MNSVQEVLVLTTPKNSSDIHSPEILRLATVFNKIVGSRRKLYPNYYDCGTTMRAIFLHLIALHRGHLLLTDDEKLRMTSQYKVRKTNATISTIYDAINTLETMGNGLMICSIVIKYKYAVQWQN